MTDELDDLIPDRPVSLAQAERWLPDRATPQERQEMVEHRRGLLAAIAPLRAQLDLMDLAFRRAAAETGARQFVLASGDAVRIEPAAAEYRVKEQALREALMALAREGLLTREEVDEAIGEMIVYRPDHRRLNALAANRGDRVRLAIERNRTKLEPSPLSGRVKYPGGGR